MLMIIPAVNTMASDNSSVTITRDFTHNVLVEKCTATWCPNCPYATLALENVYQSGDYPFYYVAMVDDMNTIAADRNRDFTFLLWRIFAFPTIYVDGGNSNYAGHESTVPATETEYKAIIEQEGLRTPKQPIAMDSTVTWEGNAKLSVEITITNEGNSLYFGRLRSYVTEINSRFNDYDGNQYHYAFIDYAVNKPIFLMPGKTKTITGSFDGALDHGGQTYEDLTSDNVMVISAVFHWLPKLKTGYQSDQYTQRYLAYPVDQTTAATPT